MAQTFAADARGNLLIATRVWSDFAATLPLTRSFSLGDNFPPEYPIYPNVPIRYHFLFFLGVAIIERMGFSLPFALNFLSATGFFLLLFGIYLLGKSVFKSKMVGFLAVIFLLFNGSLGFAEFFQKYPLNTDTFARVINNAEFTSFGPYDGKIISAFWSLNIYTNQRHLGLSYAAFIFLTLLIFYFSNFPGKLTKNKVLVIGLVIGLFPFIHLVVFGTALLALGIYFFFFKRLRIKLFTISLIALALAVPQIAYMGKSEIEVSFFNPGYLVNPLTAYNFLRYWVLNLGFTLIIGTAGLYLATKAQRTLFLPFFALFVLGNIFQFSPEIAANHKFFNLFLIGINFFTAYFLVRIWEKPYLKMVAPFVFISLVLTGVIDFFPILNDRLMALEDIPNNKVAAFIKESIPPDSIFLNSTFLYNPASLAGRKIFLGWPYFAWSAGYDTDKRIKKMADLFNPTDISTSCTMLKEEGIDYIEIGRMPDLENVYINESFFAQNFIPVFSDSGHNIYSVSETCTP